MKISKNSTKVILLVFAITLFYTGYIYSQPIPPQQPSGGGGGGGGGGAGAPIGGDSLMFLLGAGMVYGSRLVSRIKTKVSGLKGNN